MIHGVSVGDGLRKILVSVYYLMEDRVSPDVWLDLRIAMGEQPYEVVNFQDIQDVDRRARMKNKFVDMTATQKRIERDE